MKEALVILGVAVIVATSLLAVGFVDLADRLSRRYRNRPVRWRDLWSDKLE